METVSKIKPRILPRNLLDLLILIPAFAIQTIMLFIAPMFIIYILSGNMGLVLVTFILIWGYFIFGGVRYLIVNENGIQFKRILGSPRTITWQELESIEVSSPLNTIVYGWLWPPIPAREMTYSFSAYEHIQFTYAGGKRVYFPPKQASEFVELVNEYQGQALTRPSI